MAAAAHLSFGLVSTAYGPRYIFWYVCRYVRPYVYPDVYRYVYTYVFLYGRPYALL
jgi:hypothetical protein